MLIVNPRVESSFGGSKGTCDFYYSSEHPGLHLLVSEETPVVLWAVSCAWQRQGRGHSLPQGKSKETISPI